MKIATSREAYIYRGSLPRDPGDATLSNGSLLFVALIDQTYAFRSDDWKPEGGRGRLEAG